MFAKPNSGFSETDRHETSACCGGRARSSVAAEDANDNASVVEAGSLKLGPLKGNQAYELPADFDPEKHRSISVWRQRFFVNFAAARLR